MRFPSLEKCIWGSLELKHLQHEFRRFRELDSVRGMWARTPAKLKQLLNALSKPVAMHLGLPGIKASAARISGLRVAWSSRFETRAK